MNRPEDFMRRAIAISGEQMRKGVGGPFGAVVVKNGRIIAEGFNQVTSAGDPTKIKLLFCASSRENKLPRFTRICWCNCPKTWSRS